MPGRQSQPNGHKRTARSDGRTQRASSPARAPSRRELEPTSEGTRSALGAAADAVSRVVSLQSQTRSALDDQRRSMAGHVHKVRDVLLRASEFAREEHEPFARYFANAGKKAEDVAQYITEADLRRLRSDAERIARNNPGWFVGGALVAGLVLGRLFKASGPSVLSLTSEAAGESP